MPDGINTRRELIERALEELGATAAGQAPASEDVATLDTHVEPVLAMLHADGVCDALDPNVFADEIVIPLSMVLAFAAKGKFGVPGGSPDDPNSFASKAFQAERKLRSILSTGPSYAPAEGEYF